MAAASEASAQNERRAKAAMGRASLPRSRSGGGEAAFLYKEGANGEWDLGEEAYRRLPRGAVGGRGGGGGTSISPAVTGRSGGTPSRDAAALCVGDTHSFVGPPTRPFLKIRRCLSIQGTYDT